MLLITGATGTIGRHLVLELKARRAPLRVLARDPEKARTLVGPAEFAAGGFERPETVAKALTGVDSAFLLVPLEPRMAAWEIEFVRAARKAGVRRLVKVSALGAAPDAPFAVGRWHAAVEREILASGLAFTILRPAFFYQNFLASASFIRAGTLPAPMGDARLAMTDARDVASCAAAALTCASDENRTATLAGPQALSYADAAAVFARALGHPVSYVPLAPGPARDALLAAGMPAWRTDALSELAAYARSGKTEPAAGEGGIMSLAGREPIGFERFVRDHAAAFR